MTEKHGSKRDKALAAKGWAAKGLSVQEAERVMDVELFLQGQAKWEADSPHCLMMLYEMFHHMADQGWKEVEWMVGQGHPKELPKLDPEADLSAIQLVSPHTSKEELQSLYLKVYKQQRFPGSPPGEPELMEEVVSSLMTAKGGNKGGHQRQQQGPSWWTSDPPGTKHPKGGGGNLWQKEVWLLWWKPTKKPWPWWWPWKRR